MIDFNSLNSTNFVVFCKGRTTGELRIWSRKAKIQFTKEEMLTFEEAFDLAVREGKEFFPSEHLSSVNAYIALQTELNRELEIYWVLAIKNWKTKEKLNYPENASEDLVKDYNLANALLGYKDAFDLLDDHAKTYFEISIKPFVEGIISRAL